VTLGPVDDERMWADWLRGRMFDRRVVVVAGSLDDAVASRVAAELMTLDACGDEAVQLMLDSAGGTLEAALTVIDVIDLLGVPVHATCFGRAEGSAVGVFAVASRRVAAPHARFRMCEPASRFSGRASDVAAWATERERQLHRFSERLAAASGQPVDSILAATREGRYLDAHEASWFGLVDEIARPTAASVHPFARRPVGFGPKRPSR